MAQKFKRMSSFSGSIPVCETMATAGTELCSVSWTSRRPAETLFLPLTLTLEQKGGQPISHICSEMEVHPLLAVSLSPSLVCF